MATHKNIKPTYTLNCRGTLLALDAPKIMGILNTTPDSFFDGGQYKHVDNALQQAQKMVEAGADIIDIGGYSTRPGANEVALEEELSRTVPIVEAIAKHLPQAIISIDTFRAKVAQACVQAGAAIVNDVSAGDDDAAMLPYIAQAQVPYILMHKQGTPKTMQQNPVYTNVVQEVMLYLANKIAQLRAMGVHDIVVDPGFGFGKNLQHNYQLLKHLQAIGSLGVPVLAGLSRKRLINEVLNIKAAEALNGTTVLNTIASLNGAHILRVHDVKEAHQTRQLVDFYNSVV